MFAVIFEVRPKKERWDEYLALAGQLKPKLEAIDGFVENERFASKREEGRLLSLSIWRDEKAVIRWRTQGEHHGVQEKGRFEVFEDYRLRADQAGGGALPAPPAGAHHPRLRHVRAAGGTAVLSGGATARAGGRLKSIW